MAAASASSGSSARDAHRVRRALPSSCANTCGQPRTKRALNLHVPRRPSSSSRAGGARGGGAAGPKAEVRAALQALGAQPHARGPGPPGSYAEEEEEGDACSRQGGSAGRLAYMRMPSDRQLQRPPEQQAREWAHLGPLLALSGKQLLPESSGGVQARAAPAPPFHLPAVPSPQGMPRAEASGPPGATPLCVQGRAVVLRPAPAAPPRASSGTGQEEGQQEGEEVLAQDGCVDEVLAVQSDAWEARLLQWGQAAPAESAAPPCGFLLPRGAAVGGLGAPPQPPWAPSSGQQRGQGAAAKRGTGAAGSEDPWAASLDAGGEEDARDARALRQGLPPMRPHLSLCEQLVALVSALRWWW